MNVLVFDIETVPDVELGRALYGLQGLDDAAVAKAMFSQQRAASGAEFLPHVQQRVVAISCVLRTRDQLRLWSLGDLERLLLHGGGEDHPLAPLASQDRGQEVLAAVTMEDQFVRLLGRRFPPAHRQRGCAGLDVADHDEVGAKVVPDGVGSGRHLRRAHLESEGHIGSSCGLSVGSGDGEQERQN